MAEGVPTPPDVGGFLCPELLELIDREHRRLVFHRQELADQDVVQARARSLERQAPAEYVDQDLRMTPHQFLHPCLGGSLERARLRNCAHRLRICQVWLAEFYQRCFVSRGTRRKFLNRLQHLFRSLRRKIDPAAIQAHGLGRFHDASFCRSAGSRTGLSSVMMRIHDADW